MKTDDLLGVIYFAVFGVVALGSWLFMRRLSPEKKHRWYPKVSLAGIGILAPFFLAFPIMTGQIATLAVVIPAIAFIAYVNVAVVRVCKSCGRIAQPQNLVTPERFCPKCGAPLVASKVFDD
jgi:hypothetical protein